MWVVTFGPRCIIIVINKYQNLKLVFLSENFLQWVGCFNGDGYWGVLIETGFSEGGFSGGGF